MSQTFWHIFPRDTRKPPHFDPDIGGWEDKTGKPVTFPLVAIDTDRWFFDGVTVGRTGPDAVTLWVRMTENGAVKEEAFRRVRPAGWRAGR